MLKVDSTLIGPKNHFGSEPQKNPDSPIQVSGIPKSLTLYIPQSFQIDNLLKEKPPKFKGYHRDKFIYIAHLINDIPTRRKDEEFKDGFIPIYAPLLKRRLGDAYRKHLDYLIENNVLEESKQYIVGKKSKGFKFTPTYNTPIKPISITKKTLIKSISRFIYLEEDNTEFIKPDRDVNYLMKWYNTNLTINFDKAENWLYQKYSEEKSRGIFGFDNNPMLTYNRRLIPVYKLHQAQFFPTIDKTAGRLHSSLTQLKSELRQFVTYKNETLVSIDIKNSQPYLSCVFFNKDCFKHSRIEEKLPLFNFNYKSNLNKPYTSFLYYVSKNWDSNKRSKNVEQFIELVSNGVFYEEFGKLLYNKGYIDDNNIRKQAKIITFRTFFSPNQHIGFSKEIKAFQNMFPDVYKIFSLIKSGKQQHNTLACLLQNFEARLVLGIACKTISDNFSEAPIFTLHDSIITTESNVDIVEKIMRETLIKNVGVVPTLQIEKWKTEEY